jgi:asparagine synthase (glutamine-hydrolysing)
MCGVIGAFGNNIDTELLNFNNAIKLISHRGPDNQSYKKVNDSLILGHTRLSIIDINERSNQPFVDDFGNVLVFNGEIYNYKELKDELVEYKFNTNSDTEVLIHLLDKYSIDIVLNKLNGMFAFLYWNNKEKKLIVARDRIGKKPLFFTKQNNKVYFSSEAKVFSKFNVKFDIDEKAIVNFLFDRRSGIGEDTFFKNVKSIENSHYYIFEVKNSNIQYSKIRYYSLEDIKTDNTMCYDEAKKGFEKIFQKSLNLRMRSDVPIAFMLSGGLDSSAIISQVAKDNPTQQLTAISAIYPNTQDDESEYAQAVVDKYKNIKKRIYRDGV